MPKRINEMETLIRQEPFAYYCLYDANGAPEYQAWSDAGRLLTEAKWICCKNSYTSGALVRTTWAKDSDNKVADFTNIIGSDNTTADLLAGLTYV